MKKLRKNKQLGHNISYPPLEELSTLGAIADASLKVSASMTKNNQHNSNGI